MFQSSPKKSFLCHNWPTCFPFCLNSYQSYLLKWGWQAYSFLWNHLLLLRISWRFLQCVPPLDGALERMEALGSWECEHTNSPTARITDSRENKVYRKLRMEDPQNPRFPNHDDPLCPSSVCSLILLKPSLCSSFSFFYMRLLQKGTRLLEIKPGNNLTISCWEVIIMALERCNLHTLLQVMPTECQHLCQEESRAAITPSLGLAFWARIGSANYRGGKLEGGQVTQGQAEGEPQIWRSYCIGTEKNWGSPGL